MTHAVTVEEILPNGLHVTADYRKGPENKPAVLLLHGFLTVHTFSLIQKISDELSDNNYSVLAPTLSLGISKRKATLACDALHLHNMKNDMEELHWWMQWLVKRGHDNIILLGHSTGALQIIQFANQYPMQQISRVVSISLIPLGRHDQPRFARSIARARQLVSDGDRGINPFTMAYCDDNYSSPAADYLSYAEWDNRTLLTAIKNSKHDIKIIMGGADDSAYEGWTEEMQAAGARVSIVAGANHFFGSGHEFELYDKLIQAMED
jgi:pimeloyl-ACP methyl ester carboxylesterase